MRAWWNDRWHRELYRSANVNAWAADIEGFTKVETKEGTTILREKAGQPCCQSPVPAAKKPLAELHSNDGTPPKHELTIETGTNELRTSSTVDCGGVFETGGELWADRLVANTAWTVKLCNEQSKGRRNSSLSTRNYSLGRRRQIVKQRNSVWSRST